MIDEVCNPRAIRPQQLPLSFIGFKEDFIRQWYSCKQDNGEQLVPNRLISAYFDHISSLVVGRSCIDIKFSLLLNFELHWTKNPFSPVSFFRYCASNRIKVVRLCRRNLLETAVSASVAQQSKNWHQFTIDSTANSGSRAFEVDCQKIIDHVLNLRTLQALIDSQLDNFRIEYYPVYYEDFVKDLDSGLSVHRRIASFLESEVIPNWKPKRVKISRILLEERLLNYEHLCSEMRALNLGDCIP